MRFIVGVLAVLALVCGISSSVQGVDTNNVVGATVTNTHFAACTVSVCSVWGAQNNKWVSVNTLLPEGVQDATTGASSDTSLSVKGKKMQSKALSPGAQSGDISGTSGTYPTYIALAIDDPQSVYFLSFSGSYSFKDAGGFTETSGKATFRYWGSNYDPTTISANNANSVLQSSQNWINDARTNPLPSTYYGSSQAPYYCPTGDQNPQCNPYNGNFPTNGVTCVAPTFGPAPADNVLSQGTCADSRLTAYDPSKIPSGWPCYSTYTQGVPFPTGCTPYSFLVLENVALPDEEGVLTVTNQVTPACGPAGSGLPLCNEPPNVNSDPQFVGIQGQNYQFHGLSDEVFNLVSSPELQLNSLFKFIASGECNYNDTLCWTHPGTYLGRLSIQFGNERILFQSGSHSQGLVVMVNDSPIAPSNHSHHYQSSVNSTLTLEHVSAGIVEINTNNFYFRIVNSDYFFNMDFGLKDQTIIHAGARHLAITGEVCEKESHSVLKTRNGEVEKKIKSTYPPIPLHGLLGQTWRNAVYCGRYFEGNVDDYIVGDMFGNEHTFNLFNKA